MLDLPQGEGVNVATLCVRRGAWISRAIRLLCQLLALLIALSSAPSVAQGVTHFYCYVPYAAKGVVYMSPILRVGPIAERAGYGKEFVAYLRSKGLISGAAQGYCTMRPSPPAVEAARINLSKGYCAECGGATKVEEVAWRRAGEEVITRAAVVTKAPAGSSKRPLPPPDPPRQSPEMPLGVVMGNIRDGSVFYASLGDDPFLDAIEESRRRGGEWRVIFAAREAGHRVSFACVVEGEGDDQRIHFFSGADFDARASMAQAREEAARLADQLGRSIVECGKMFVVSGRGSARQASTIDYVKGTIRSQFTRGDCDPTMTPKVSARLLDEEKARPNEPQLLHELLETPGPNGRRRCIDEDRPGDRSGKRPVTGVRG